MNLFRSRFLQAAVVVVLAFCALRFGIQPPVPWSVIKIYMFVVLAAVFIYVSSDTDSWRSFLAPIRSTLVDPDRRVLRGALMIVIPLLVGYYAYSQAAARAEAPPELRAVHPALAHIVPGAGIPRHREADEVGHRTAGDEDPMRASGHPE